MWEGRWRVIPHDVLPDWLKDNDFLLHGHRPPMPSFRACFKSIFRIHTETGNIWTHLLGNAQTRSANKLCKLLSTPTPPFISGMAFSFYAPCKADCARLYLHLAAKHGYCVNNEPLLPAGCLFFLCLGLMYMFRPNMSFVAPVQEKVVIGMFFLGAILCLSFSWLFHTVYCHSEGVSRVFSK